MSVLKPCRLVLCLLFSLEAAAKDHVLFNTQTLEFEFSFEQRKAAMAALHKKAYQEALQGLQQSYADSGNQKALFYFNRACVVSDNCQLLTERVTATVTTEHPTLGFYHKTNDQVGSYIRLIAQIATALQQRRKLIWFNDQKVMQKDEALRRSDMYTAQSESLTAEQVKTDMVLQGYQFVVVAQVNEVHMGKSFYAAEVLVAMLDLLKGECLGSKAFYHRDKDQSTVSQKMADDIGAFINQMIQQKD